MKKTTLLLFVICCVKLYSQEVIYVNLYATTQDYLDKTFTHTNAEVEVIDQDTRYLKLGRFTDAETGKKLKRPNKWSWMLEHQGQNYICLGYVHDNPRYDLYMKLDIEGKKLGSVFMDREMQEKFWITNSNSYGGGLAGELAKASEKWGANWINKDGEKIRIVTFDFSIISPKFGMRNESSLAFFLNARFLKILLNHEKKTKELKKLKFEEVIEILKELN